jgi:hypothetical protein
VIAGRRRRLDLPKKPSARLLIDDQEFSIVDLASRWH